MQRVGMRLGRSRFFRRSGKGGWNEQWLAGHRPCLVLPFWVAIELCFEALIHDAFVRGVHIDHDQSLRVFRQYINALQLCQCAAQRPVLRVRMRRLLRRVWGGSNAHN